MRKRRRTKYHWLPIQGQQGAGGSLAESFSGFSLLLPIPAAGTSQAIISDVTFDVPGDVANTTVTTDSPLNDLIGANGYVLKRIVGKCFAAYVNAAATSHESVIVTCGFFVGRCDEQQADRDPLQSGTLTDILVNYGPQNVDNVQEPWIWRRTWILGNPAAATVTQGKFPFTNAAYGSVMDGPHIDSRVARRIDNDNRLYFVAQARGWAIGSGAAVSADIRIQTDLRLLGAMRKSRSQSAF